MDSILHTKLSTWMTWSLIWRIFTLEFFQGYIMWRALLPDIVLCRSKKIPWAWSKATTKRWRARSWHVSIDVLSNIENWFFKMVKIMVAKLLSSMWVCFQKGKLKGSNLTPSDVYCDTNIQQILNSRWGYRDFEVLHTSPDFKEKLKKKHFVISRQLGTPTFFVNFFAL